MWARIGIESDRDSLLFKQSRKITDNLYLIVYNTQESPDKSGEVINDNQDIMPRDSVIFREGSNKVDTPKLYRSLNNHVL